MPAKVILVLAQPYNDEQHQRVLQRVIASKVVGHFWSSESDVSIIVLVNPSFSMLLETVRDNVTAVFMQDDCRCHILYAGFTVNRTSNWLLADCVLTASQLDELLTRCQASVVSFGAVEVETQKETRKNNNDLDTNLSIDCRSMPPDNRRCSSSACNKVSKAFHTAIAKDSFLQQVDALLHTSRLAAVVSPIGQPCPGPPCSLTIIPAGDGDSFIIQLNDYRLAVNVGFTNALSKHILDSGVVHQLIITHLGFDTVSGLRYLDAQHVKSVMANIPIDMHASAKHCTQHSHSHHTCTSLQGAAQSLSIEPINEYRNFVAQLLHYRVSPLQYAIMADEQTPKFITLCLDEDSALLMLVLGPHESSTEWLRFGQLVRGERFNDAMRLREHTYPLNDLVSGAMLLMSVSREENDMAPLQVHTVLYPGNLPTRLLLKELDRIAGLDLHAVAHAILAPRTAQSSGEYVLEPELDTMDFGSQPHDSIRSHFQLPLQRFAGGFMRPLVTIDE